ncbi:MAG: outer membrane beta-barrel protein [Candidatus Aminicenantes bacterium]|nr:outer membrane beta-barrel protein [Candidatus Aminicenantes bacterium]
MKKTLILTVLLACVLPLAALDLDLGLQLGPRTAVGQIKDTYGGGLVFFPSARLNVWQGLGIGLGYELGYKREATIGLFDEESTLKVSGFEAFVSYEVAAGKFRPYARLGLGSYKYSQEIESQFAEGVDDTKTAVSLAAGVKVLFDGLFVSAELKHVPLKVQPLTEEVDLGGLRLLVGVGYRIGL